MDNIAESFGGHLIDTDSTTDKLKTGKYWLLTYYNNELYNNKFLDTKIDSMLCDCPSMDNFVYQIEKERPHINIAIQLKVSSSKPIRYFMSKLPGVIIYIY